MVSAHTSSGFDIPETIDYFRTPFPLRSALKLVISFVSFVWLDLFYRTRDLYVSARAALSRNLRFRIPWTARHLIAVVCPPV